jgi:hypothetical protein
MMNRDYFFAVREAHKRWYVVRGLNGNPVGWFASGKEARAHARKLNDEHSLPAIGS